MKDMCKVCSFWAREFATLGDHHPNCPFVVDPKRSVPARAIEAFDKDGGAPNGLEFEPGGCQWMPEDNRIMFTCPGCAQWGGVRVGHPKPVTAPSWDVVAGDPSKPETLTLQPSILCKDCCGWHGYLTNGVFTPC